MLVAERALGRKLPSGAQVHHVNEIKTDNRPDNLVICPDAKYHRLLHVRQRIMDLGGNPNTDKYCSGCKKCVSKTMFGNNKYCWDSLQVMCRSCMGAFSKAKGYKRRFSSKTATAARRVRYLKDKEAVTCAKTFN